MSEEDVKLEKLVTSLGKFRTKYMYFSKCSPEPKTCNQGSSSYFW